jgi:hypothetical protein
MQIEVKAWLSEKVQANTASLMHLIIHKNFTGNILMEAHNVVK